MLLKCCTQYKSVTNLEDSAVAIELESVGFHSNPKDDSAGKFRLLYSGTRFTRWQGGAQNPLS